MHCTIDGPVKVVVFVSITGSVTKSRYNEQKRKPCCSKYSGPTDL